MGRLIAILFVAWLSLTSASPCRAEFSSDFATSDECAFCHNSGSSALVDSKGNDLSIAHDWSSTMMANSFKDPLFRAKFESEVSRTPHLAAAIEDKCLTCHAPMARTQAMGDGARRYSLSEAEHAVFAWDGVSCTLCHQIAGDNLGSQESFSGNYTINTERKIYGPYTQVFANPMLHHVNYLPVYGDQVGKAELCATCHTLFTPYVDREGNIAGEFPEQTPYLEWLNSYYATADDYRSCQDCHMPRIDEPVKITNRPPWYQVRQSPFWQHEFTGGNRYVLEMMQENTQRLGIGAPANQFDKTIARTAARLQQEAAEIKIERIAADNNRLQVEVSVVNKTGHKFPTGFPSRRAWIHLTVVDRLGREVFASGSYTPQGRIMAVDASYQPHYDVIDSPGQVQIYQAIMADVSGEQTFTLLQAATYMKDNRLPPRGYRRSGPMVEFTSPAGKAIADQNFNTRDGQEGSGTDLVRYQINLGDAPFPLTVKASLLYQSNSPAFIENLLEDATPAAARLQDMAATVANTPVIVDSYVVEWAK